MQHTVKSFPVSPEGTTQGGGVSSLNIWYGSSVSPTTDGILFEETLQMIGPMCNLILF